MIYKVTNLIIFFTIQSDILIEKSNFATIL